MERERTYRLLMIVVMAALLLPLLQESTGFFYEKPLGGAYVPAKKPRAGFSAWWEGTFQDSFEVWQNEQFGFRGGFVRLHNQVEYELFNVASANGVVIGKNGYLYEYKHINAYYGDDFIGVAAVNEMAARLRTLQDTLAKMNITLIVAIAPGKATYYPEYIPDHLVRTQKPGNYQAMRKAFTEKQLNFIDYNKWFREKKETSSVPLYPKTGIHWSQYGALLAVDSLIHYIEVKRNIDMPSIVFKDMYWSDSPDKTDDDIGRAMNLLFPIQPLRMAYPVYDFENPEQKTRVRMMSISDSFFWNMFETKVGQRSFSGIDFWYYNNQVYHTDGRPMGSSLVEDCCLETERNDVVFILMTESNLSGLGWGYVNEAYDYFVLKNTNRVADRLVRKYETKIRMDQDWLMMIKSKADARKIPLDSMIRMDARFLADQEMRK